MVLSDNIDLNSRSGTPVLSENTGKIIGILTGGGCNRECKTYLYLAPASSIHQALMNAREYPFLREVVGKSTRQCTQKMAH